MKPLVPLLLLTLLLAACYSYPHPAIGDVDNEVDRLSWYLTGTFDSSAQAAADPDNYFNIRLVMVRIWQHQADGRWLYVEQAAAYATSEVTITPDLLVSWDRGWTADGTQAWGATEGGYRFVKISGAPPPRP